MGLTIPATPLWLWNSPYDRASPGRVAQWESARLTRERSLVRTQPRPSAASGLEDHQREDREDQDRGGVVRRPREWVVEKGAQLGAGGLAALGELCGEEPCLLRPAPAYRAQRDDQ